CEFTRLGRTHALIQLGNHHAGTFLYKAVGYRSTNALTATGHDTNFPLQTMCHVFLIPMFVPNIPQNGARAIMQNYVSTIRRSCRPCGAKSDCASGDQWPPVP